MSRKALFFPFLLFLAGCAPKALESAAAPISATVSKGVEVHAVLLKELTSGGTGEGETIPLVVSEDVRDAQGHVLVAKGTPLTGKVTWSRSEGSLGGLTNRPARLNFEFQSLDAVDGTDLKLSADRDEKKDYELNRDNTGKFEATPKLESIADDGENEKALAAVRELFESGDTSKWDDPETKEKLASITRELGLANSNRVIEQNDVGKVNDLVKQLRQGGTVAAFATGGSTALVDAALELAGMAGQVGSRLSRMVGGRNVRAYVGTPVTAYVIEEATIKVKSGG